ncbi:unnamed protein product, partial [Meganyctiphanes norvegica]
MFNKMSTGVMFFFVFINIRGVICSSPQLYYNGMAYDPIKGWGSTNYFHVLGETLMATHPPYITPSLEGNYTCQMLTPGGCYSNYTITLIVYGSKPTRELPVIDEFSEDVLTPLERSLELFCSARVGVRNISSEWTSTLKWYFLTNGSLIELGNEDLSISISDNDQLLQEKTGIIRSTLVIPHVSPAHLGTYTCIAQNQLGEDTKNITVSEGVPENERYVNLVTQCVNLIASNLLVLLLFYVAWQRFRIPLKLYYLHRKHVDDNDQDRKYLYDVVVIHGSSSSEWVYKELLPHLDGHYGYTCFLPHRDCPAGEILWESVCRAVNMSRMVLVVVTRCLATEPGDNWMMMQALAQALQEHTKIAAIIKEVLPGLGNLHENLRSVQKIYYPSAKTTRKSHHNNNSSKIDE